MALITIALITMMRGIMRGHLANSIVQHTNIVQNNNIVLVGSTDQLDIGLSRKLIMN